eukprot:CAMPEP_0173109346 /NCGR_PEP_ID=MMETSP1102-20130122/43410_1 /TAXON_ID=49646 /ORGANISM="Geminigera sp., Strain Caron Lab Isolate" /LENGTH=82 /DNA_ID=CAMNT_0014008293 /DNA_START=127 /DNA_END=373 /DNA_ORIENTATION=+
MNNITGANAGLHTSQGLYIGHGLTGFHLGPTYSTDREQNDAGQISPICAQRTHEWVRPPSSGELDAGARGLAPGSGPGSEEF